MLDMVIDVPVVLVVRVHKCRRGEDSRAPTVALVKKLVLASVNTAEVSADAAHRLAELPGGFFRAVCTGTRPGGSCPQRRASQ